MLEKKGVFIFLVHIETACDCCCHYKIHHNKFCILYFVCILPLYWRLNGKLIMCVNSHQCLLITYIVYQFHMSTIKVAFCTQNQFIKIIFFAIDQYIQVQMYFVCIECMINHLLCLTHSMLFMESDQSYSK